jgi:hypothetical protein
LLVGSRVAIVQDRGVVRLIFELRDIVERRGLRLVDGTIRTGYVVRAKEGSLRRPSASDPQQILCRWRAVGQFRYFDARTWKPVLLTEPDPPDSGDFVELDRSLPYTALRWRPFHVAVPGRSKGAPESLLVREYVEWVGAPDRFGHHYLPKQGDYADLFDRSNWRLIQTTMATDRIALRTAVGQLLDYRRCYLTRPPSLGILLPERPGNPDLEYLGACKVTAIWRSPSGKFYDSTEDRRWSRRVR